MLKFVYRGYQNGQPVSGKLRAGNEAEAERTLLARQIVADQIECVQRVAAIPEKELIQFTKGMASLLRAGVPLAEAGALWTEDLKTSRRWEALFRDVLQGISLAETMRRRKGFPAYLVAMVGIGEATATLPRSFQKSAEYLLERRQLRQTLISALIYPAVVLVVAAAAMAILMVYVLPVFEEMYGRFNAELPFTTRLLLNSVAGLKSNFWIILAVLGLAVFLTGHLFRDPQRRLLLDAQAYRIPVLGGFLAEYHQTRFCQALGHLLDSGVGLLDALDIVSPVLGNLSYKARAEQARFDVARGVSLAQALREHQLLSNRTLKMVQMAEQSGSLSGTLLDLGEMMKQSIDHKLKTFAGLFEPILIVGLAVLIGFVLAALYLPMFDIVQIME